MRKEKEQHAMLFFSCVMGKRAKAAKFHTEWIEICRILQQLMWKQLV